MSDIIFSRQISGIFAQEALRQADFPMAARHFHENLELYFMLEGERYYFVDQDTYHLQPGIAILVNRNQIHKTSKVSAKSGHHRFMLHLDAAVLDSLFSLPSVPSIKAIGDNYWGVAEFSAEDWQLAGQLMDLLKKEMKLDTAESDGISLLLAIQLLLLFVRNRKDRSITEYKHQLSDHKVNTGIYQKIHEIALYLQNHCSEPCTLDMLSAHFYISGSYLTRVFKSVTGFTVTEYLTVCRVRKAKQLLCDTGISITEIAAICGFGNITYFERVFKRITEYTPLQYRKAVTIPENRIQK